MATLDQLASAFLKADAAGNIEDAKIFAAAYREKKNAEFPEPERHAVPYRMPDPEPVQPRGPTGPGIASGVTTGKAGYEAIWPSVKRAFGDEEQREGIVELHRKEAERQQAQPELHPTYEGVKDAWLDPEVDFSDALGKTQDWAAYTLGEQTARMAPGLASAAIGARGAAALMPFPQFKPAAAVVGGSLGLMESMHLPEMVQSQIAKQELAKAKGEPVPEFSEARLWTAAVASTATEVGQLAIIAKKFPIIKAIAGLVGKTPAAQIATKIANESWKMRAGKGALLATITELPQEIAQTMIERWMNKDPLLSKEAFKEYEQVAATVGVVAPVYGSVGGMHAKMAAGKDVAAEGERQAAIDRQKKLETELAAKKAQRWELENKAPFPEDEDLIWSPGAVWTPKKITDEWRAIKESGDVERLKRFEANVNQGYAAMKARAKAEEKAGSPKEVAKARMRAAESPIKPYDLVHIDESVETVKSLEDKRNELIKAGNFEELAAFDTQVRQDYAAMPSQVEKHTKDYVATGKRPDAAVGMVLNNSSLDALGIPRRLELLRKGMLGININTPEGRQSFMDHMEKLKARSDFFNKIKTTYTYRYVRDLHARDLKDAAKREKDKPQAEIIPDSAIDAGADVEVKTDADAEVKTDEELLDEANKDALARNEAERLKAEGAATETVSPEKQALRDAANKDALARTEAERLEAEELDLASRTEVGEGRKIGAGELYDPDATGSDAYERAAEQPGGRLKVTELEDAPSVDTELTVDEKLAALDKEQDPLEAAVLANDVVGAKDVSEAQAKLARAKLSRVKNAAREEVKDAEEWLAEESSPVTASNPAIRARQERIANWRIEQEDAIADRAKASKIVAEASEKVEKLELEIEQLKMYTEIAKTDKQAYFFKKAPATPADVELTIDEKWKAVKKDLRVRSKAAKKKLTEAEKDRKGAIEKQDRIDLKNTHARHTARINTLTHKIRNEKETLRKEVGVKAGALALSPRTRSKLSEEEVAEQTAKAAVRTAQKKDRVARGKKEKEERAKARRLEAEEEAEAAEEEAGDVEEGKKVIPPTDEVISDIGEEETSEPITDEDAIKTNRERVTGRAKPDTGYSAAEAEQQLQPLIRKKRLHNLNIKVVATASALPESVRNGLENLNQTLGVYDQATDTVYIVADQHSTKEQLMETLAHEAMGHAGFARLFQDSYNKSADTLFNDLGGVDGIRALAEKLGVSEDLAPYLKRFDTLVHGGSGSRRNLNKLSKAAERTEKAFNKIEAESQIDAARREGPDPDFIASLSEEEKARLARAHAEAKAAYEKATADATDAWVNRTELEDEATQAKITLVEEFLAVTQGKEANRSVPAKVWNAIKRFFTRMQNWFKGKGFVDLANQDVNKVRQLLKEMHRAASGVPLKAPSEERAAVLQSVQVDENSTAEEIQSFMRGFRHKPAGTGPRKSDAERMKALDAEIAKLSKRIKVEANITKLSDKTPTLIDKWQTKIFSHDAGLQNVLRRSMRDAFETHEEFVEAQLDISLSQPVNGGAYANQVLHMGKGHYDAEVHKWVAEDDPINFKHLLMSLDDFHKRRGDIDNVEHAQSIAHDYFEAIRLHDIKINHNDKIDRTIERLEAKLKTLDEAKKSDPRDIDTLNRQIERLNSQKKLLHMTEDQVAAGLLLAKKYPELEVMFSDWTHIRKNIIDIMVESGRFTEDQADELMSVVGYVPFYRESQIEEGQGPQQYIQGLQIQADKAFKGSKSARVNNIFHNIEQWIISQINRSVHNRSGVRLAEWSVVHELAKEVDADAKGNIARVFSDGEAKYYEFLDPLFMDAFTGIDGAAIPALDAAVKATNAFRKFIVLNPLFGLTQVPMDSIEAIFTSGLKPQYAVKLPLEAVKEMFLTVTGLSKTHKKLKAYGVVGRSDWSDIIDVAEGGIATEIFKSDSSFWTPIIKWLEGFSMAADNSVRQAVYKLAMKQGLSEAEALEKAFEIINFRRQGSSPLIRLANRVVPFSGAYFQAMNVTWEALSTRGISPQQRGDAISTMLTLSVGTIAMGYLYAMMNAGDDRYVRERHETRDRRWVIPGVTPEDEDILFGVPMRNSVWLSLKILGEYYYLIYVDALSKAAGGTKVDTKHLREALTDNLVKTVSSPGTFPQIVKPVYEVYATGKSSFTDLPIIPRHLKDSRPFQQVGARTSEFAKFLGNITEQAFADTPVDFLRVSPVRVDHILNGYGASLAGGVTLLMNEAFSSSGVRGVTAALGSPMAARVDSFETMSIYEMLSSVPGLRSWFAKASGAQASDYYDLLGTLKSNEDTLKTMFQAGDSKFQDYYKEFEPGWDYSSVRKLLEPALTDIRARQTWLRNRFDMSTKEKAVEMRRLDKLRQHYLDMMAHHIHEGRKVVYKLDR